MQQIIKEKEAKRNTKALSLKAIRSKGQKGQKVGERVSQTQMDGNREQKANKRESELIEASHKRALQAAEIDEYLIGLVMKNMIDEHYWKFHTKCVYTLGFAQYHQLVIEAYAGHKPKNLLAFKLKGAMTLHYKKKFLREQYQVEEE